MITFYKSTTSQLSTVSREFLNSHSSTWSFPPELQEERVCSTLTSLVLQNLPHDRIQDIVFLNIDVEGHDYEVLEGIDFGIIRPSFILLEIGEGGRNSPGALKCNSFLVSKNYTCVASFALNALYSST